MCKLLLLMYTVLLKLLSQGLLWAVDKTRLKQQKNYFERLYLKVKCVDIPNM